MARSRNWCFTDFEYLNYEKIFKNENIRFIGWGEEICPKTRKKHIQGWIQFEKPLRLKTAKGVFETDKIHLEKCRGNEAQNEKYCSKEGKYKCLGEYKVQGERTDLKELWKKIEEGETYDEIVKSYPETYCRYRNGIKDRIAIQMKEKAKKFRKVEVDYIWGESGTGKTRKAMETAQYKIEGDNMQWWDGYNGEETILIDEYSNDVKITRMLNLLDGYQLRLPIKGGFTYANWHKVIITSNLSPEELHPNAKDAHKKALFRRITNIIELK